MKAKEQLIKTALLGTARSPVDQIEWPQAISHVLQQQSSEIDAESLLLNGASLWFAFQDGGQTFSQSDIKVELAFEEQFSYCSKKAAQLLKRILQENHIELLKLWLQACLDHQQLVPPAFLPALLDLGKRHIVLRSNLQVVTGERGKWLAQKNSDWQYILQTEEKIWELGKAEERKQLLANLRNVNPQAALSLLQSSWKSESADVRADFLTLLEIHLSTNDLTFLEEALLDKSKKVKSTALNLLLLQKDSSIAQQIFQSASAMLEMKKGKSFFGLKGPSIGFVPISMDRQLAEYGVNLESLDKKFSHQEYYLYELIEVIAPSLWENHFQIEASAIIQAFQKDEKLVKFIPALIEASVLHKNSAWADAIVEQLQKEKISLPKEKQYLKHEAIRVLSAQDKEKYFPAHWATLSLLEYLQLCDFSWSVDFSRKALQQLLHQYLQTGINPYDRDKMTALFAQLHPEVLKEKTKFLPPEGERKASWREALDGLFTALEIRASVTQVFKN